jgi:hypothetical protein
MDVAIWVAVTALWAVVVMLLLIWRAVMGNSMMHYHNTEALNRNTSKMETLRQKVQDLGNGAGSVEQVGTEVRKALHDLASQMKQQKSDTKSAYDKLNDEE